MEESMKHFDEAHTGKASWGTEDEWLAAKRDGMSKIVRRS